MCPSRAHLGIHHQEMHTINGNTVFEMMGRSSAPSAHAYDWSVDPIARNKDF